ncbi:MAG: PorP/SprF family type IX secretion system membrane protein [Saprospiraceae bacterium]|nr:PorP/SprF family type IX secretion system membrane protein [Saprospiraceae bacterium]
MKKTLTFITCIIAFSTILTAQDQHFTQFYASPLTLNPALAGAFDGKYRLAAIYRDQWRNVLDDPYVTMGGAIDMRFARTSRRKRLSDAIGAGVQFFSDRVPSVDFATNQIMVSGAYHKSLNTRKNDQFLSLGVQFGIAQRNINYERINFGDQFNGNDGYTEPTGEILPENNFSYGDIAVGLNYSYAPKKAVGIFVGGAIHHITEPQVSFFIDKNDDDGVEFNGNNKLHRKYTAHIAFQIPIGERVQLLPRALVYKQGPHTAANIGSNIRFLINDLGNTALHLGGWARPVSNQDNSFSVDAAVVMLGLEFNTFLLGLSYDANLNYLNTSNKRQGAFEISIALLGQYENETVLCPSF